MGEVQAEDCALYVHQRLDDAEIAGLLPMGIEVTPDLWIPPVPGKHQYGFHVARVDYASLDIIRNDPRVVFLESLDSVGEPANDLAKEIIRADMVHAGLGVPALDGAGVTIAIADSGVDLTHPDFPTPREAFDLSDGTSTATWGTDVANTVSGHGTLVTGSAVGDGSLSGGSYAGSAPGADLNFYKIGDDITGSAPEADIIEAISRALTVGSDIFSMSYVGVSIYMDGSGPTAQAIDAAHAAGMMCFFAAGNGRARDKHFSIDVAPNTNTGAIAYTIDNSTGRALTEPVRFRVIWIDGTPDANLTLALTNPGPGESLVHEFSGTSPRGTETRQYVLTPNLSNGVSKTYQLALRNTAVSGPAPLVHIFVREDDEPGTFDNPDPAFTVRWPAIADSAIAVGAWTHRTSWIDFNGSLRFVPLASRSAMPTRFSAFGPRIDGVMKPDIVAPGQGVITTRDRGTHITTLAPLAGDYARIIDDDGVNVDGSGPANYYVVSGTSLASSMAAGAAALLLEADNSLTPERVMQALCSTASNAVSPDNTMGFGVIDVFDAICTLDLCGPGFATFGTGCIAGADVPILDAASGYLPRLGETFTMEISNLPASALAYGVLGLSDSYFGSIPLPQDLSLFGFPDCVQYVSADYITPQLPQAGGVASWDVLIPNAISGLAGVQFFAQGVVLFGSGEGAVSNAASCVIGAR